ncbi:DUF948 domain-containing protein [Paenibacillus sp. H1-7]|uniref:DUF948 domain-containing protein n=1 Tax=Paenibacillus sp. H1-7 TaxID=2282849 RepID=UPI001EF7B526|nr:DUF948 domain-containing protein [Paenibacillus sp. H1-7]ULL13754.1 DUF948 domain-containing protein [Paenibacillus sp. H1-7]
MIIEISVAVIALAFVVLVAFLIVTLRSMSALLGQTNNTIRELQYDLKDLSKQATDLLQHTNEVTVDVLHKLQSLEPTFDSVKQVGEAVEEITSSVKQASTTVAHTIKTKVTEEARKPLNQKIAAALQLTPIVMDLWQQLKQRQQHAAPTVK